MSEWQIRGCVEGGEFKMRSCAAPEDELCAQSCCTCEDCVDTAAEDLAPPVVDPDNPYNTPKTLWFGGDGTLGEAVDYPRGCYRVYYITGSMRLNDNPSDCYYGWDAAIAKAVFSDGTEEEYIHTEPYGFAGDTAACGTLNHAGWSNEADAITHRQSLAEGVCFFHCGGKIGVRSADSDPHDNVAGTPPPTYRLQECVG